MYSRSLLSYPTSGVVEEIGQIAELSGVCRRSDDIEEADLEAVGGLDEGPFRTGGLLVLGEDVLPVDVGRIGAGEDEAVVTHGEGPFS